MIGNLVSLSVYVLNDDNYGSIDLSLHFLTSTNICKSEKFPYSVKDFLKITRSLFLPANTVAAANGNIVIGAISYSL
jgi:hypothetical protein